MLQLLFVTFLRHLLTARGCPAVSLFGPWDFLQDDGTQLPVNVTITRPIGSCNSDNSYNENSDMFVCDEDGTLRYLYWMGTENCNSDEASSNQTLTVGETIPFPSEWSDAGFIVESATCEGAVGMFDGVPCEISMFSHETSACVGSSRKAEKYSPGCNFVANERTASLDCCDDGESLRFRMYAESDGTCSGDPVYDVTMTNDDTACIEALEGMQYSYSFEWTLACQGAPQVTCPASSTPSDKAGKKVVIGIFLLLFLLVVAGSVIVYLKRTRVSRYKRQVDEGAENLTSNDQEAGNLSDSTKLSMQETAENAKKPPTEKPPTEKDPLQSKVY